MKNVLSVWSSLQCFNFSMLDQTFINHGMDKFGYSYLNLVKQQIKYLTPIILSCQYAVHLICYQTFVSK
jgi:hypothetical protein